MVAFVPGFSGQVRPLLELTIPDDYPLSLNKYLQINMKLIRSLWNLHAEAWRENFIVGACISLFYTCVLTIIGLALWLIFGFVDSVAAPYKHGNAVVCGKDFTAAHSTTTYIMVGKMMIPNTTHYNDAWSLQFSMNGQTDWMEVSEESYDAYHEGDPVQVVYRTGRFSGGFYVGSFHGLTPQPTDNQ